MRRPALQSVSPGGNLELQELQEEEVVVVEVEEVVGELHEQSLSQPSSRWRCG